MRKSGDLVTARKRVLGNVRPFFNTIRAALHEIFDESAYLRFLERTGSARSRESYRAFQRERDPAVKPRCC
jgi:hypothetical protein